MSLKIEPLEETLRRLTYQWPLTEFFGKVGPQVDKVGKMDEGIDGIAGIAGLITRSGQRHAAMVEAVLRQLVAGGKRLEEMRYQHLPDIDRELLMCQDVCVLTVKRSHDSSCEGYRISIKYLVYPDGRPKGWPELDLSERDR